MQCRRGKKKGQDVALLRRWRRQGRLVGWRAQPSSVCSRTGKADRTLLLGPRHEGESAPIDTVTQSWGHWQEEELAGLGWSVATLYQGERGPWWKKRPGTGTSVMGLLCPPSHWTLSSFWLSWAQISLDRSGYSWPHDPPVLTLPGIVGSHYLENWVPKGQAAVPKEEDGLCWQLPWGPRRKGGSAQEGATP